MKLKSMMALLLVISLMAALLTACADSALKAAAGTYVGQYVKLVGDDAKKNEQFSLTLLEDGTGKHSRDGMEFDVTWTLEGETFTMKETFVGEPILYTGTMQEGRLDIFNGDPESIWTYEYVYQKQ